MMKSRTRPFFAVIGVLVASAVGSAEPFVLVVMDPLSKPLACDCVRGYAQREYKLLATHLESSLGRQVKVIWTESFAEALEETDGKADLVIGKHSVVLADEKVTGYPLKPIAQLTDKNGSVSQKGLIVVRKNDPAKGLRDLEGYDVLLGPPEAEEKSSAAEDVISAEGVELSANLQRYGACSEAASALLEFPDDLRAAAVISSYAQPLLEGCGSIEKGELRVIGETKPVPFVTAFISDSLDSEMKDRVLLSLLTVGTSPELLTGLETLAGFLPWSESSPQDHIVKKKTVAIP